MEDVKETEASVMTIKPRQREQNMTCLAAELLSRLQQNAQKCS